MTNPKDFRVLLLAKKDNVFAERAAEFIRKNFVSPVIFFGTRHDKLPTEVLEWEGDLLVSFISSWVLPPSLLNRAKYAAINFHPGSPAYPGIGCTNFAIYNDEKEYGVTAHYMKPVVDSGDIIAVRHFQIGADDSVYSVTQKCYQLIEELFFELMECILQGNPLPVTNETWKRKPYTRKQLDELCHIKPDMPEDEVEKRIRATTYKTPWAFTRIGSRIFKLQS